MSNLLTMGDDFMFLNDFEPSNEEVQFLNFIDLY